ncbi:hypothetical protein VTN77DRAFT_436 [Rasamsonia byssochlamydoides]|uniref:uncharacterized protein n=1 Tax=Rasamsonia byssochlamydoides TaxID=89139 RepID=UPI0037446E59
MESDLLRKGKKKMSKVRSTSRKLTAIPPGRDPRITINQWITAVLIIIGSMTYLRISSFWILDCSSAPTPACVYVYSVFSRRLCLEGQLIDAMIQFHYDML